MTSTNLLELEKITIRFGSSSKAVVAVEDLSLSIEEGQPKIIAIAGESRSGKTTLGRIVLGLVTPTSGKSAYRGRELASMTQVERKLFRREVQAILQDPFSTFNPFYPIDHLLRMPLKRFGIAHERSDMDEHIRHALEQVGLGPSQVLAQLPHFQNFFGAFLGVIAREAAILLDRYPKNANYSHELCALCSCRNWVYKLHRHACSSSGPPNDSRARPTSIISWWSRWRRIKDPVIG